MLDDVEKFLKTEVDIYDRKECIREKMIVGLLNIGVP